MNPVDTRQSATTTTETLPAAPAIDAAPVKSRDDILDQIVVDCGQHPETYLRESHAPEGE